MSGLAGKSIIDKLTLDRRSGKLISTQIADFYRSCITCQDLKPGDRLPTTQEFVKMFNVGSHTVRQAMGILEKEGFVESSPRRGTFVRDYENNNFSSGLSPIKMQKLRSKDRIQTGTVRIAVMGSVYKTSDNVVRYRSEILEGILAECDRHHSLVQILPEKLRTLEPQNIFEKLISFGCDGVVWPSPSKEEWTSIEFLKQRGIPVIATRRSRMDGNCACIESDFDRAGFQAGNYFAENGCSDILIFTHYLRNSLKSNRSETPLGIKEGLIRGFLDPSGSGVKVHTCNDISSEVSSEILNVIKNLDSDTGIVFTNGYQFLKLLEDNRKAAISELSRHRLVVVSDYDMNIKIAPLVDGLDFWVLVDPFAEIGRTAVQKLFGMINGFLEGTTTLVKIRFQHFNQFEI
jgi:DNA-binding LacI/PurR family transcriptional regulator